MTPVSELGSIFKAYDVRGLVPQQLDEHSARAIGIAFAQFVTQNTEATQILVGRDMRTSGIQLADAIIDGITSQGLSVIELGLCSTDLVYFASGKLDAPALMLTASHNPGQYNGMKMCLAGAKPLGEESGLFDIRDLAVAALATEPAPAAVRGSVEKRNLLDDFAEHVHAFIDVAAIKPLKVVADTANGMGGLIAPKVFAGLPMSLDVMYGELDGSFPNHPADPIQPENLVDLQEKVRSSGADVGLAFDGDADRVFLVDEKGELLSGSITTAIVARAMLEKHAGATVLYNCICSKVVRETIAECGGVGVRTRVGHSFIKAVMADTGAVFGGEHSGHYYFQQNYRADSGIIAALVVLEVLSDSGMTLSELRAPYDRYAVSGEINTEVAAPKEVIALVQKHYESLGAEIDLLDGLTVDLGEWWFNLRPSNTEPLLRLNVEAADEKACAEKVSEVQKLMTSTNDEKAAQ